jgi:hypothetical protein
MGPGEYFVHWSALTKADSNTLLQKFVELCPECHYDVQPLHWYDVNASDFQAYIVCVASNAF